MQDRKKFAQMMSLLCEVFKEETSEALTTLYWHILEPYSDEQCATGFKHVIATCKFFPKPVELREAIEGNQKEQALLQWDVVLRTIRSIGHTGQPRFEDPVTAAIINNSFGGWYQLSSSLLKKDESRYQRDFVERYVAYSRLGLDGEQKPALPYISDIVKNIGGGADNTRRLAREEE